MPLVLKIDVSEVLNIGRYIQQMQPGLDTAIPLEINIAGADLFRDVLDYCAKRFPGVPEPAIAAAMYSQQASILFPTYTIGASDDDLAYVRWATLRDERVCKICGPRDGRIYPTNAVGMIFPAHPSCRCRLERLKLAEALIAGGYEAMPDALGAVAGGILEHFERLYLLYGR